MKLYEVPRRTWVRPVQKVHSPPAAPGVALGEEIFFDHIDGMYSYCKNKEGQVVHMAAWTEVEVINDTTNPPPTVS